MKLKSAITPISIFVDFMASTIRAVVWVFNLAMVTICTRFCSAHCFTAVGFSVCFRPTFTSSFVTHKTRLKSEFFRASSMGIDLSEVPKNTTFMLLCAFNLQQVQLPFLYLFHQAPLQYKF